METWEKLPLELMDKLAESETYRRDVYRPIYSMHKWWARRPGSTFRCLGLAALSDDDVTRDDILTRRNSGTHDGFYINPDESRLEQSATVLDPFAGGGTTLVELNRLGANIIGYEINPVAWWTQKKSLDDVNLDVLEEEFERIIGEVRQELDEYYTTIDSKTGQECEVLYYFQSQVIPCLTCDEDVRLFPGYQLAKTKKTSPGVIYCPNKNCDDRIIRLKERKKGLDEGDKVDVQGDKTVTVSNDDNEVCPNCGHEFDPTDGNAGWGKYTCSNGHKHDIKETLQRQNEYPSFERFALQYVTPTGEKRYKEFDENDTDRVVAATERFDELENNLPIPSQHIPEGLAMTTGALRNYNYEQFRDLFTERHLLTFGLLFKKSWAVRHRELEDADPQNIAEALVTAVSNCLNRSSLLCKWDYTYGYSTDVFARHAYIPRTQPVESNPINREGNIASVRNFFEKVYKAKEYTKRPFEKIKNPVSGDVEQFYVNGETVSPSRVSGLNCKTSERLEENDNSVDYIISDPPYYDNVQYSSLSDYFYVWLHECLTEEYDEFEPDLVPKAREIVAKRKGPKDEEFFIDSLINAFQECNRVLKDDGEMVFTYHHNENEAWAVILESLIKSGFTITGAYPVQSEMPNSSHISDLDNAEYDIIIFANKEDADEDLSITELRENLHFELQDMAAKERKRHKNLSAADLGVILRGKCMYYYSKHYPKVYSEGEQVTVDEALDTVDDLIQQTLEGTVDLPSALDPLTHAYAAFRQRGLEDFDTLNKHLLARNLNVSDLEDEELVKGPRDRKEPITADERIPHIETKLNGGGGDLLAIDKVQYLYHLYKTDQNTREYLKDWKSDDLQELAEFMTGVTGDDRYENVMEMSLTQF